MAPGRMREREQESSGRRSQVPAAPTVLRGCSATGRTPGDGASAGKHVANMGSKTARFNSEDCRRVAADASADVGSWADAARVVVVVGCKIANRRLS